MDVFTSSNLFVLGALSFAWQYVPLLVLLALVGKALTRGKGGLYSLSKPELLALAPWHLGHGVHLAAGPFVARGCIGWIDYVCDPGSRDDAPIATAWFMGVKPPTDVYAALAPSCRAAVVGSWAADDDVDGLFSELPRLPLPRLLHTTPVAPVAAAHRTFRYLVSSGYNSSKLTCVQLPSLAVLPQPYAWQRDLAARVCARRGNTVLLLTGAPGCGKSHFAEYMAAAAVACDGSDVSIYDFNPSILDHGTQWLALQQSLGRAERTAVFVIDEVDVLLQTVFAKRDKWGGAVGAERKICPACSGKVGWNYLLDGFSRVCDSVRTIVVMTSNRSRAQIVHEVLGGDEAPLRDFRVHMHLAVPLSAVPELEPVPEPAPVLATESAPLPPYSYGLSRRPLTPPPPLPPMDALMQPLAALWGEESPT